MSSYTPAHPGAEQLRHELDEGWKPLPFRTLLAMAMGGLRVRIMRSTVTMLSIVLAIAFLAYTGISSKLSANLVNALEEVENYDPIPPAQVRDAIDAVLASDPVADMPLEQQLVLAQRLGMDRIDDLEVTLPSMQQTLENRSAAHAKEEQRVAELREQGAPAAEIRVAQSEAQRSAGELQDQREAVETARATIALGRWIRSQRAQDPAAMQALLAQTLSDHVSRLIRTISLPERFDRESGEPAVGEIPLRLDDAQYVLDQMDDPALQEPVALLQTAIGQERQKRQATELKNDLRYAGVSVQSVREGNPLDTWLIIMALLTCAVGIANAMLMSVTERIREIGTMKCLGAQDNLVVKLFLLESSFLGMVGAAAGIVLGLLVALLAATLQFGGTGVRYFPWFDSLAVIGWSVLAGIALAVVGAVYPAWAASRMKPVDALRVDE